MDILWKLDGATNFTYSDWDIIKQNLHTESQKILSANYKTFLSLHAIYMESVDQCSIVIELK